jgi:hypothetical protein
VQPRAEFQILTSVQHRLKGGRYGILFELRHAS